MNIIKNNPFRILGLPANSTEKEIQKNIKTLKRFAEVGKSKEFDFDFLFFGDFSRNVDTVQEASSRIEQMPKKIQNALFWFINNNRVDETALNYLKDNDIEKAIEIWQKTLKNEITEKNYSSYANLSTLLIGVSSVNGSVKKDLLKQGIELKGKLLSSDNLKDFVSVISGNGHVCNTDKLNSEFTAEILQLVKPYLKNKDLTQREFISYFSVFHGNVQKSVLAKFSETHVFNIEKNIENTVKKRNETPQDAEEHGEELYKNTKKDIAELKKIFGINNIQFQMIADKLANEILQCSVEYFNDRQENGSDSDFELYLNSAIKLVKLAGSVAISNQVKERVKENKNTLLGMKDREVLQAIDLLQSVKDAFETNKANITRQVRIQEASLAYGQSINWTKVNELIKNSIDWDKVTELILKVIPSRNIEKIKNTDNPEKLEQFRELVEFIFDKMNYSNKNRVKYLRYWKTVNTKSRTSHTSNSNTSNNQSEFDFATNAWWIIGLIGGIIIGAISESWGGFIIGSIIVGGIVAKITK